MADEKSQINFDPMDLSIQDIEDIETGFNMKFGDLMKMFKAGQEFDITQLESRTLAAMAFMVFRVSGRDVTVASVKSMKLGELMEALTDEAGPPADPTGGDS